MLYMFVACGRCCQRDVWQTLTRASDSCVCLFPSKITSKSRQNALPKTGNLHIIGYNIDRQPYLNYGVLSPNGSLLK